MEKKILLLQGFEPSIVRFVAQSIYYVETTYKVILIGNLLKKVKKDCSRIYRSIKIISLECDAETYNDKSYSLYDRLVALKRAVVELKGSVRIYKGPVVVA
jgi:esterase/lipase